MKEVKFERRCVDCDTVNPTERNTCENCGHHVFARYRITEADEEPTSAPITERKNY